jgi:hypothetical protein
MKRDIHEVIEEFLLDRFKEYESPDLTDEWFTDTFIPNLSNINDYYNSTDCFSSVVGFISAVKFVDKYHKSIGVLHFMPVVSITTVTSLQYLRDSTTFSRPPMTFIKD